MAHKIYYHHCKEFHDHWIGKGVEICPHCGETGEYNGWDLSVVEHMCSYQRRYNLRAIGPHRKMQDELFDGRMKKCDRCNGRGVIGINNDENSMICPKCDFRRELFDGTPEEFESIRQKIIATFPTAEPGSPLPEPVETAPAKKRFVGGGFSRPRDQSLQAYKDFIMGFYKAINPNSEEDTSIKSDEEWEASWKKAMSKLKPKDKE